MLTVISPAKKLDMDPVAGQQATVPAMQSAANSLARTMRGRTQKELQQLMDISPDLAKLNADRFKTFADDPAPEVTKQAAFAFAGDTYTGLEARSLDADEVAYAQEHLRILSGLYGLLRPLDAIQPYRLEMGSRLKTRRGKNLYDYWGSDISKALNAQAEEVGTDILLNCASQEYFGSVDLKALKMQVITPQFFEDKPGGPKMVSFFAKQARGSMARFMVQNRVTTIEGLRDFSTGGYKFQPSQSDDTKLVFIRPDQTTQKAVA